VRSVGYTYDDAMAESFFASPECDFMDDRGFQTETEARLALFTSIERWYTPRRRHYTLGRICPINFQRSITQPQSPAVDHVNAAPEVSRTPSG